MKNLNDQFATYSIALKLNELGFNEPCLCEWNISEQTNEISLKDVYYGLQGDWPYRVLFGAPLWQQAINWLKEKYNIRISIDLYSDADLYYVVKGNFKTKVGYIDKALTLAIELIEQQSTLI